MFRRLIPWVMATLLLLFIVVELTLPLIVEKTVSLRIREHNYSNKRVEITSPRPHSLSILRKGFKGTLTLRNVSIDYVLLDLIKLDFSTGLFSSFTGNFKAQISQQQLEEMLYENFEQDIRVELRPDIATVYLEKEVLFTELSLVLQGDLEVRNGHLKYNIHEINSNIGKITGSYKNELLNSLPLYYPLPYDESLSMEEVKIIDGFIILTGQLK
ncbi:hypothetical protein PRVXT_000532 [Proteinivorax tanatarense]|uniref:Uncharacterized protein n=1 Tax=Proteinivorax tanatarense TaxID=1260629 RepID=A0AAU7VMY2_9FIRM